MDLHKFVVVAGVSKVEAEKGHEGLGVDLKQLFVAEVLESKGYLGDERRSKGIKSWGPLSQFLHHRSERPSIVLIAFLFFRVAIRVVKARVGVRRREAVRVL